MSEPVWDGTGVPPAPEAPAPEAKDSEPKAPKKTPKVKASDKDADSTPTEE